MPGSDSGEVTSVRPATWRESRHVNLFYVMYLTVYVMLGTVLVAYIVDLASSSYNVATNSLPFVAAMVTVTLTTHMHIRFRTWNTFLWLSGAVIMFWLTGLPPAIEAIKDLRDCNDFEADAVALQNALACQTVTRGVQAQYSRPCNSANKPITRMNADCSQLFAPGNSNVLDALTVVFFVIPALAVIVDMVVMFVVADEARDITKLEEEKGLALEYLVSEIMKDENDPKAKQLMTLFVDAGRLQSTLMKKK